MKKGIVVTGLFLFVVMISLSALLNYSLTQNVYGFGPAGLGPPMAFTGSVALNGAPARDGLNLTAWDNAVSLTQPIGWVLTSGGQYSNLVVCGQPDQSCNNGDAISFKLNSQLTASETGTYAAGEVTSLDLHFTGQLSSATTASTMTYLSQTTTTSQTVAVTTATNTSTVSTTTEIPEFPNAILALLGIAALSASILSKSRLRKTRG